MVITKWPKSAKAASLQIQSFEEKMMLVLRLKASERIHK